MPNSLLELWIAWVTAHLLGDFIFQTDRMAARKRESLILVEHTGIHALLAFVLAGRWGLWGAVGALAIWLGHGAIDWTKARFGSGRATGFVVDQLAHLALLAGLAEGLGPRMGPSYWIASWQTGWEGGLILLSGAIVCVRVAGFLIGFAVQPLLNEIRKAEEAETRPRLVPRSRGLTHGGRMIGQWERLLIFLLILIGQPGGLGFLIAAKSVFRFGELKDPENRREAEYITIGTLMSFAAAIAVSYLTLMLIQHLLHLSYLPPRG